MNFNEYKSAEYWQKLRNLESAKLCLVNFTRAAAMTAVFALFPILYCFASMLDG